MTTLPTPARARELAAMLDRARLTLGQGYGFGKAATALRQFATLIESIESIHRMAINKTDMITADAIMMIKRGEMVS